MNQRLALLISFLFVVFQILPAQNTDLEISMRNFTFSPEQMDDKGRHGIGMQFDLRFSKIITDFRAKRFEITWRLEDQAGKVVYQSKDQDGYEDEKEVVHPSKPWKSTGSYMEDTEIEVSIPYTLMKFQPGQKNLKIIFSAASNVYQIPDFATKDISFVHKVFVRHSLEDQSFEMADIQFEYEAKGFAVDEPGMQIIAYLRPKYRMDEADDNSYQVSWLLRDQGKILFDSRKCPSIHHQQKGIYLDNLKEDGTSGLSMFVNYSEVNMTGPAEVEVVLIADSDGKTKEIYAKKHLLNVPVKYRFEEQEFKLSDLGTKVVFDKGAQGIRINCKVQMSKFGPRIDPVRGDFYIYPVFRDEGGNVVWKPEKLHRHNGGNNRLSYALTAFKDEGPASLEFFIPFYELNLPPGAARLQYSIFASDKYRNHRFPELSKGGLVTDAPKLRTYEVHLTNLNMKDSDYDTEVAPFGSRLPDLQWSLKVGSDRIHVSSKRKNSLTAPTGEVRVRVAEGDSMSIVLYDIDSGFFNASDFLGRWYIPYMDKGEKFVIERSDEGLLNRLRVEVVRR